MPLVLRAKCILVGKSANEVPCRYIDYQWTYPRASSSLLSLLLPCTHCAVVLASLIGKKRLATRGGRACRP